MEIYSDNVDTHPKNSTWGLDWCYPSGRSPTRCVWCELYFLCMPFGRGLRLVLAISHFAPPCLTSESLRHKRIAICLFRDRNDLSNGERTNLHRNTNIVLVNPRMNIFNKYNKKLEDQFAYTNKCFTLLGLKPSS